jgi:hypothetical protein
MLSADRDYGRVADGNLDRIRTQGIASSFQARRAKASVGD